VPLCLALKLTNISVSQVENDIRSSLKSNRNNASVESIGTLMLAKSATRIAILGISTINSNVRHRLTFSFPGHLAP
jgi:peroxisomal leader peptide-processing protease